MNQGIELWHTAVRRQLAILAESPEIPRNSRALWSLLNTWTNSEWQSVMEAVITLWQQHPELFTQHQITAMQKCAQALSANRHPRILDTREYKPYAWRMMMTLREIWLRAQEEEYPA